MTPKSCSCVCHFWPYSGLFSNTANIFPHDIVSLYCSPFPYHCSSNLGFCFTLFCYRDIEWLKGQPGSVSGYTFCRSLRTLGQNINMSHRTLPRPARFTGFGLGMPDSDAILYRTLWDFSSSSLCENLYNAIL